MANYRPSLALESGLDLRQLLTTGSVLHINEDYNDMENSEVDKPLKHIDFMGKPIKSFSALEGQMIPVDKEGLVTKKIIEEGGGLPLHQGCTVHIAFSSYWENDPEPFDVKKLDRPKIVDMQDNGLLPGLLIAVESMLVGEMSLFLLSYQVMYGVLGSPPRIKPKASCAFYIKLLKSTLTPQQGNLDLREPNLFQRVYREAKLLHGSGWTLFKSNNYSATIKLFRRAIFMLHRCPLANEKEEQRQEKMLKILYFNCALCYNAMKQPLKACVQCNELHRLRDLWNNSKALFQNAKALRMIGQFDEAEKRLTRAKRLCKEDKELALKKEDKELKDKQIALINAEFETLIRMKISYNQSRILLQNTAGTVTDVSAEFKEEVDKLIKSFKENDELCRLTLPEGLNSKETDYVRQICIRENLFFNKIQKDFALDKDDLPSREDYINEYDEYFEEEPTR